MTQLELVKHEKVLNENGLQSTKQTIVAVSTSAMALSRYCEIELGEMVCKEGDNNNNNK